MKIITIPVTVDILLRVRDEEYQSKDIARARVVNIEGHIEQAVEKALRENLDIRGRYTTAYEIIGASAVTG
jgi:hypothetical protein